MTDGRPDETREPAGPGLGGTGRPNCWRRRTGRVAFKCLKLSGALVALAIVAAGILTVRLNQGPITIDGLGQKISGALNQRFGRGIQFAIGGTSLVQRGFGPSLSIDRLSVKGPDGQSILAAPKAEVYVDTVALMFGRVVPKRLEVFDVTLRFLLKKDGNLALSDEKGSKPFAELGHEAGGGIKSPISPTSAAQGPSQTPDTTASPQRAAVMKKAAAGLRQFIDILTDPGSAIAAVDRLGISHGTLVIADQETNRETAYKDLELAFDKAHGVTTFMLAAQGPDQRWSVTATANGRPGADRHFAAAVKNVSIDEMQLLAGSRSLGVDTDMMFGGRFDIGLKPDNTLSEAVGGFETGPGYFRNDDPDMEPYRITKFEAGFHWDPETRHIAVDRLRYVEGTTHLSVAGNVMPPLNEGEPWRIALATSEPGVLGVDRKGQRPVGIERGLLSGRLLPEQKRFVIDRLAFEAEKGGAAMAGQADWVDGPHLRLGAVIDPTPVYVVQRVWPTFMAAPVRAWVINNFESGIVTEGKLRVDLDQNALRRMRADRSPPDGSVAIDFKVKDGRLRYLAGVPPLENVEGFGHISGRSSRLTVNSSTTNADGRTIQLTRASFFVPNSNVHPVAAILDAHLSGPVEAVTNILSRDALKPYASIPLDPSTLHGNVEGDLQKTLSLGAGSDSSRPNLVVNAQVSDFVAERLVGKQNLEQASLAISVGSGALKATGQGRIFGGPASFEIDRTGTNQPTAAINIVLDDAARAKLGLSVIPGVSGPITAQVNASLGDPTRMKAQVELDLAKTSVAASVVGVAKPAGKAAKVSFTFAASPERTLLDPISVDVGNMQGRGAIELTSDNAFKSARFSSFKISPGDDMRLDVLKNEAAYKLTVRGSTIDARPFLKALTSTATNEQPSRSAKAEKKEEAANKSFDIDLKAGLLTGANKEVMSNVDLKLSKRGAQFRQFSVQGRFGRELVVGSMGASQRLKVTTGDAGALVAFIDLYKHMEGGDLSASMIMSEDRLDGKLEIHDFVLRDEPAIRRLVATSATISAPGDDTNAARRIDGGAVEFKRLKVNFERAGPRLELRDATMYGPEIGLSVDGWLDYTHDRVAMKGTFVPAYAVNNLFSQIPVFGLFLGGKSNEGLFAITFNISGLASSPTLGINPLSSIAPGFLRNIFGILDGPGGQVQMDGGSQ